MSLKDAETNGSALLTVVAKLIAAKPVLLKKYPIKSLAVFGSVSRDEDTGQSDVDILVDFSSPIGIEFITLAFELEDILARKVDLVSRGGITDRYFEVIEPDLQYV